MNSKTGNLFSHVTVSSGGSCTMCQFLALLALGLVLLLAGAAHAYPARLGPSVRDVLDQEALEAANSYASHYSNLLSPKDRLEYIRQQQRRQHRAEFGHPEPYRPTKQMNQLFRPAAAKKSKVVTAKTKENTGDNCAQGGYKLDGHIRHYCFDNPGKHRVTHTHADMVNVTYQIRFLKNITTNVMIDMEQSLREQADNVNLKNVCQSRHHNSTLNITKIYREIFEADIGSLKTRSATVHNPVNLENKKTRFLTRLWEKTSGLINPMEEALDIRVHSTENTMREDLERILRHLMELFNTVVEKNYENINEKLCKALLCAAATPWTRTNMFHMEARFCRLLKDLDFMLQVIEAVMVDDAKFFDLHKRVDKLLPLEKEETLAHIFPEFDDSNEY